MLAVFVYLLAPQPASTGVHARPGMGSHVGSRIPGTKFTFVDLRPTARKNDCVSPTPHPPVHLGRTFKPGSARRTSLAAKVAAWNKRAASAPAVDVIIQIDKLPFHTTSSRSFQRGKPGAPRPRRRVLQFIDFHRQQRAGEDAHNTTEPEAEEDVAQPAAQEDVAQPAAQEDVAQPAAQEDAAIEKTPEPQAA